MESIQQILQSKIEFFKRNPEQAIKEFKKDSNKDFNECVSYFHKRINSERPRNNQLPFVAVREKLLGIQDIEDLRWFYRTCNKYSRTKDKDGNQNTFSKCFWGALKR